MQKAVDSTTMIYLYLLAYLSLISSCSATRIPAEIRQNLPSSKYLLVELQGKAPTLQGIREVWEEFGSSLETEFAGML